MIEDCRNCLCPDGQAAEELSREKAIRDNEAERRKLISDLEEAGVTFPVTELEMMAHRKMLGEDYFTKEDPPGMLEAERAQEDGDKPCSGDLTQEDYATNMPDDLKDLLRRYYQLEAERDKLEEDGIRTAPNSENGDVESPSEALHRVTTPRAPFWFFRKSSVAVVENEKNGFYEAQNRSGKSRHVTIPKDDASDTSSRVTVVYPKERACKIRLGLLFCCLVLLALAGVIVYYAMDYNEKTQMAETLPKNTVPTTAPTTVPSPSPTRSPTASPTENPTIEPTSDPCVDEIQVIKECHIRGEPIGTRFQNCDPLPDDWLGLYSADDNSTQLSNDFVDWMYTCGNKQCRGVVQSSFYSFQLFEPGTYQIHLIRNRADQPYTPYASTAEIEVMQNRLDCPTEVDPELIPESQP